MDTTEYWNRLGAPHYSIEPLREDARVRWTREFAYEVPVPRNFALAAISRFAASTRDTDALLTGYLAGDPGVGLVDRVGFTRDPHPEPYYRTLSPGEYDVIVGEFAAQEGLWPQANSLVNPFRVLSGRVPGFTKQPPYAMDKVRAFLSDATSLTVQEVHFFGARYNHDDWDEPAADVRGDLYELQVVALAAYRMRQMRFVCEAIEQTVVYNLISPKGHR